RSPSAAPTSPARSRWSGNRSAYPKGRSWCSSTTSSRPAPPSPRRPPCWLRGHVTVLRRCWPPWSRRHLGGPCRNVPGAEPVSRAEACGPDFYAALDAATAKLDNRLRRAADRRRVHHGRHTPPSVRVMGNTAADVGGVLDLDRQLAEGPHVTDLDEHLPGRIV